MATPEDEFSPFHSKPYPRAHAQYELNILFSNAVVYSYQVWYDKEWCN